MERATIIKELAAMQKDLQELKRDMSRANTKYNRLNYRVNQMKRKLSAALRNENKQGQSKDNKEDKNQTSLIFLENNIQNTDN